MGLTATSRSMLLVLALCAPGCVIIPYKPGAEVTETREETPVVAELIVTVGPREWIEDVSEAITDEDDDIRIVPSQEFLDAAFADMDTSLARMLEPSTSARARERTGARFLVLVADVRSEVTDKAGDMVFFLGLFGLFKQTDHDVATATLIELGDTGPPCDISSHAQGTSAGIGAFYALFVSPMTKSSARDGLARGLVAAIRERAGEGPVTIAVLAAEYSQAPAPVVAPADPAAPPVQPQFSEMSARIPPIAAGSGRVIFYRRSDSRGQGTETGIVVDGVAVGMSNSGAFFFMDLASGDHTVACPSETTGVLTVTLAAGETKYVRTYRRLVSGRIWPELVPADEGRGALFALRYNGQEDRLLPAVARP